MCKSFKYNNYSCLVMSGGSEQILYGCWEVWGVGGAGIWRD